MLKAVTFIAVIFLVGCSHFSPRSVSVTDSSGLVWLDEQGALHLEEQGLSKRATLEATSELKVLESYLESSSRTFSVDAKFETVWRLAGDGRIPASQVFHNALAQFLLSPDFACSRPLINRYFEQRYQIAKPENCSEPMGFRVFSHLNGLEIKWIRPEQVKEIHVLFAGNTDGLISRFGHMSLRLVICPDQGPVSQDCDSNLYEHIVLGYRAHVNELTIDSIKGLMGDYRAYLFANPFMEVYQEYAINEFRDLYSLPLDLTKHERAHFLRVLSEVHWSFAGTYRFLNENCATWLQELMREVLPDYGHAQNLEMTYWRPDSFFEALQESSLVDASLIEDRLQAETKGYFFPNTEPAYERALETINKALTDSHYDGLDRYVATDPRRRFIAMREDKAFWSLMENDDRILGAQLLLEELSLVRLEQRLLAEFSLFLESQGLLDLEKELRANLPASEFLEVERCLLEPFRVMQAPILLADGIPSSKSDALKSTQGSIAALSCRLIGDGKDLSKTRELLQVMDEETWRAIEGWGHFRNATIENILDLKRLKTEL